MPRATPQAWMMSLMDAPWYPFCQDYKNLWKREQILIEKEILKQERLRHKQKSETRKAFKVEPVKPRGLKEKLLRKKSKVAK